MFERKPCPKRTLAQAQSLLKKLEQSVSGIELDGFWCSIVNRAVRIQWIAEGTENGRLVLPCYETLSIDSFVSFWLCNAVCDSDFLTKPELNRNNLIIST